MDEVALNTGARVRPARSVGSVVDCLLRRPLDATAGPTCPIWPPDVFAVAAYLLDETGLYVALVEAKLWPPVVDTDKKPTAVNWNEHAEEVGHAWLPKSDDASELSCPEVVSQTWDDTFARFWDLKIETARDLSEDRSLELAVGLARLLAYADQACAGMGIPREPFDIKWKVRGMTRIQLDAIERLIASSSDEKDTHGKAKRAIGTLCDTIDSSMAVVLPKTHTPRAGATIRSMSHNLALVRDTPVEIRWDINTGADPSKNRPLCDTLNLLLVPWPYTIPLDSFRPSERSLDRRELAPDHRYFDFDPPPIPDAILRRIEDLIIAAESQVGPIDGVVFPELSMRRDTFAKLAARPRVSELPILIAGVADRDEQSEHGQNLAILRCQTHVTLPGPDGDKIVPVEYLQHKHHRWFLERYQIENYGLAGKLDPEKQWWESTSFRPRRINFVAMQHWLTLSLLICEDLARPDPVAEVVRAVGPNLVIALLLDGPQKPDRWASRWASTLVDDPGSSVLILTSLGMALRDVRFRGKPEARQVGLWTDRSGFRPLILEEGAAAIAITLASSRVTEYSLDGRGDEGMACSVRLAAVQSVRFDLSAEK